MLICVATIKSERVLIPAGFWDDPMLDDTLAASFYCQTGAEKYLVGQDYGSTPHYQVPAIQVECHIWHDYIIWMQRGIKLASGFYSRTIKRN